MDFPVCLNLAGKRALVVGGGPVALRKAEACLRAGASLTIIARDFAPEFDGFCAERKVRAFDPADVTPDFFVVFVATDDRAVNQAAFEACRAARVLVNVADDPARCDFTLPAVARAGHVTVAVSSDGRSPALSARLKDELARAIPHGIGELSALLALLRARAYAAGPGAMAQLKAFVAEKPEVLVAANDAQGLDRLLERHFGAGMTLAALGTSLTALAASARDAQGGHA